MRCGGRVRVGAVSMQAHMVAVKDKDKLWTVVVNRLQVSVVKKVQSGWN